MRLTRSVTALALAGSAALATAGLAASPALASSPADSGTLSPADSGAVSATWTGTAAPGANADSDCSASADDSLNDHHTFALNVPVRFYDTHSVTMSITSTASLTLDNILTVIQDGASVGSADGPSVGGTEVVTVANPTSGAYDAITCAFAGGGTYDAAVTLTTTSTGGADGGVVGGTSTTAAPSTYGNFPIDGADDSGEPSIGVDWKTGNVYFQSFLTTYKAQFPDYAGTAPTTTDVSCLTTSVESLDPILFTDSQTGITGTSQLLVNPAAFNSLTAFFSGDPAGPQSDCTPSNGGGEVAGPDHQTLGGGAYPKPVPAGVLESSSGHAFYYCSQAIVTALCARSDTDGAVFNNSGTVPYTLEECGGLHGHIRVGPEGNAYLPNKSCIDSQGLAVSTDAGQTWQLKKITDASPGATDPSVAADRAGTVYFGYVGGDGLPAVTTSSDAGDSWTAPVRVGDALGIKNAVFSEVIAGDAGRAAFGFVGTTTEGDRNVDTFGKSADGTTYTGGEFHFYVATTVDNGQTWKTVDITPNDPVQRGMICTNGTTCSGGRNLLDFNDITVDKTGHVVIAYADGCTDACVSSTKVSDNGQTALGTIARQVDGPLLFAAGDGATGLEPVVAEAPVAALLPLAALAVVGGVVLRRRRSSVA